MKHESKDETEFFQLIKEVEDSLSKFEDFFAKVTNNISEEEYKDYLDFSESIARKLTRLGVYVSLTSATNTKSQKVMKYQSLLDALSIKVSDKVRPIAHWEKGLDIRGKEGLDDKNAKRLIKVKPLLAYNFMYSRELAKHTLPEQIEQIIHRKDINGVDVIGELYEKLSTSYSYTFAPDGEEKQVFNNQKQIRDYVLSTNAKHRKAAYEGLFQPYKEHKEIIFTVYAAIVKDWQTEQNLRKYPSAISMKNVSNHLRDEVIQTLLKACDDNIEIYQEYFKLKAKALGTDKLNRYDFLAPVNKEEKPFTFEEAKSLVLETFKEFHPDFASKAQQLFDKQHIDSHPKENKCNGAFQHSVTPDITGYVMLNFNGKERDVSTMAHELGHAIHGIYSQGLPLSVMHSPVPLAETASTFAELLLFEKLLSNASAEEKKALLFERLCDSYSTIIRQANFTKFEIEAHKKISEGLTEEELSNLWLNNLKQQFGDNVELPESFKYEWLHISHIFWSPFYCYGYAFGELLSMALFAAYKKEGKDFIPKLEKILSAGGSEDPEKLLKDLGFDITDEKFWQSGFDVVKGWLGEVKL